MASLNFLESSSGLKGHLGLIVPLGGSQVPDWTCWAIVTLLYVQETKLVLQLQRIRLLQTNNRRLSILPPIISAVPSPRGDFGGLSPPNKVPSPPKQKHKTLYFSWVFVNFIVSSPPAQTQIPPAETQSPPIENFLATVLNQWRDCEELERECHP